MKQILEFYVGPDVRGRAGVAAVGKGNGRQAGRRDRLLPNGWKIAPVGQQVPLDTLPMSSAISPNGKFILVLNGGYRPPSISVIDAASRRNCPA